MLDWELILTTAPLYLIATAGARSISKAKASFLARIGKWVSELFGMVRVLELLSNFKSMDGCSLAATKIFCFEKIFLFRPKNLLPFCRCRPSKFAVVYT